MATDMADELPQSLANMFGIGVLADTQKQREHQMLERGVESYRQRLGNASVRRLEHHTVYGRQLIERYLPDATTAIRQACDAKKRKPGKKAEYVKALQQLMLGRNYSEVLAALTLVQLIAAVTTRVKLAQAATDLGRQVDAWRRTEIRRRTERQNKRVTEQERGKRLADGVPAWSRTRLRAEVGLFLLETVNDALQLFDKEEDKAARRGVKRGSMYYVPTDSLKVHVDAAKKNGEWCDAKPRGVSMLVAPRQWHDAYRGGYLTPRAQRLFPLVRRSNHLRKLSKDQVSECLSPEVLESVNAVQCSAYRVNGWVLQKMLEARDGNVRTEDANLLPRWMPASQRPKRPNKARGHEARVSVAAQKAWDEEAEWNNPHYLKLQRVIETAQQDVGQERIFLPIYLDYRGRLYYQQELSPQGGKAARALLEAAEGCVVRTPSDVRWLKIHVASNYGHGVDRLAFDDRVKWFEEHEIKIKNAGHSPWEHRWWIEAFSDEEWEDRWRFLAACHEYASYAISPEHHVSHAIMYLDGTCNGIQHLAAMCRDEVAGRLVNIVPQSRRADIYQTVWDAAEQRVRSLVKAKGLDGVCARAWAEFKGDRKFVKTVVMNYPNGISAGTACRYLREQIAVRQKRTKRRTRDPFARCAKYDKGNGKRSSGIRVAVQWFYAQVLRKCLDDVLLKKPLEVQGALRDWAAKANKAGVPLQWTTPDGFRVHQQCFVMSRQVAKVTLSAAKSFSVRVRERTDKQDSRKQANAVVPNFVHSMDATALRLYVREAVQRKVAVFALAHDCYGCRVTEVESMREAIRTGFMRTYEGRDPLADFRNQVNRSVAEPDGVQLRGIPARGTLELSKVLDSEYLFS